MHRVHNGITILITFFLVHLACATPVVEVVFPGLLGNRLFVFCIGKILSEKLQFNLYCQPIWGFPNTYEYQHNKPSQAYSTQFIYGHHDIDIRGIVNNHALRNVRIQGFFQRYAYLKDYSEKIRNEWLKIDDSKIFQQDPDDVVVHIRTQNGPRFVPFEFYQKALALMDYKRLFICIDEPEDPFLEYFKPYDPIVKSTRSINDLMSSKTSWDDICKINLDDFFFICSFNKIITSDSTYGWWAAFLSRATEIYAPFCNDPLCQIYGKVEENRYHYIETSMGR